jgi:Rhodopirellula transposase DDE domain
VEHGGASLVFVHQLELERRTPGGYETVVNLIGSTRTQKDLRVKAKLDKKHYETGKKISDEEMDQLNIKYDKLNPQWNYTIYPRTQKEKVEK